MDHHIQKPLLLHTAIAATTFFWVLITNLPQSHCEENKEYTMCSSRPYNCGEMKDVFYPFWDDHNRPRECGGGDPFKLNCTDDRSTTIQIGSRRFSVHNINSLNYTMNLTPKPDGLAYEGYEHAYCSPHFVNMTLPPTELFHYTKKVHNISIFVDCPSGVSNGTNAFKCPNYEKEDAFFVDVEDINKFPRINNCNRSTKVQALQRVPLDPRGGIQSLNDALSGGFEVQYTVADAQQCKQCVESKGACGVNVTDQKFTCYRPSKSQHALPRKIIIGVASAISVGFIICVAICCNKYMSSTRQLKFLVTIRNDQDIEAFLKNHEALAQKRYKYSEVKKMTNSFKVKLGQGGFGSVYKGELLNGCCVAVKILNESKGSGEEFINEVASISRTSHVNVVTLIGFCLEGSKKALIYEFMPNGSLDKFIHNKGLEIAPSLSWDNLWHIAVGIARGLEYLHRGCNTRILHFDIKPHNILLDENFCPKISDFGLAKLCHRKESIISMSDARGTLGYVAPEVWNRHFGGVSNKSDVYSYGMMLLEMVGGRKNINAEASQTSEIYFPDWVYNRLEQGCDLRPDGVMAKEENEITRRMTLVGLWCIQTLPNDRPTMSGVIDMLEDSMNSLEMPPKPVLSSPTRSVTETPTT